MSLNVTSHVSHLRSFSRFGSAVLYSVRIVVHLRFPELIEFPLVFVSKCITRIFSKWHSLGHGTGYCSPQQILCSYNNWFVQSFLLVPYDTLRAHNNFSSVVDGHSYSTHAITQSVSIPDFPSYVPYLCAISLRNRFPCLFNSALAALALYLYTSIPHLMWDFRLTISFLWTSGAWKRRLELLSEL